MEMDKEMVHGVHMGLHMSPPGRSIVREGEREWAVHSQSIESS